ncbi:unnamed protein product, partial [Rotaria sp. Silwood2]
TFECKFQAALYSKTYEPAWFKNGLPIEPSDRHLISTQNITKNQSTKYSLIIKNINFTDEGIYELRNDYLILETPFIRIVKVPVQPILSRTVIKGDDFEINLPINRNEQQLNQMIIFKDNQSMKDINKRIKYFDHKQVQFKLSNLILDDCGSYEIDEIGKRTHTYILDVKEQKKEKISIDLNQNTLEKDYTIMLIVEDKEVNLKNIQLLENNPSLTVSQERKVIIFFIEQNI